MNADRASLGATIVALLLATPAFAAPPVFDVQTTETSIVIKNLTAADYMELAVKIDGCGQKLLISPGGTVSNPLPRGRHQVEVKSVKLTPMRDLREQVGRTPRPSPTPIGDPKVLDAIKPTCIDFK